MRHSCWLCIIFIVLVFTSLGSRVLKADAPTSSPQQQTVLVDARDVPFEKMSPAEQVAYKKRVKSEVVAAVSILCVFVLFVFIISAFRFGRSYTRVLKLNKEKKYEYVDIWGQPRVHQDDLPTDDEMQGEDNYQ